MIGKLERVPLREVWRHEAFDFTTWLQDNIDVLNDVIDLNLSNPEREQRAGGFSVDLVAEDDAGNPVIIENQLETSNHDHLGKLITYLTALEAKTAIWIVANTRQEHIGAISWLNESSAASFYLLKLEGVRIGDSPPAPLLTLIVGPSEEAREVGKTKKDLAEREIIRRRFWTRLLDEARSQTSLHANISPNEGNFLGATAGRSGLIFMYTIIKHGTSVELYIDRGKDAGEDTRNIFDTLLESKGEIESSLGDQLLWYSPEGKRACRIRNIFESGGWLDEDKWPDIHAQMIDAMIRLEKALKPHIERLPF